MANSLDAATLVSIAKNRSRLMKLAEGIKTRKKPGCKKTLNLKLDPAYTNIEHLVFGTYRPRSSTPVTTDRTPTDSSRTGDAARQERVVEEPMRDDTRQASGALSPSLRPPHPAQPEAMAGISCECNQHSPRRRHSPGEVASPQSANSTLNLNPPFRKDRGNGAQFSCSPAATSSCISDGSSPAAPVVVSPSSGRPKDKINEQSLRECIPGFVIARTSPKIEQYEDEKEFVNCVSTSEQYPLSAGVVDTNYDCASFSTCCIKHEPRGQNIHSNQCVNMATDGDVVNSASVEEKQTSKHIKVNEPDASFNYSEIRNKMVKADSTPGNHGDFNQLSNMNRFSGKSAIGGKIDLTDDGCTISSAKHGDSSALLKTLPSGVFVCEEEDSCYGHSFGIIGVDRTKCENERSESAPVENNIMSNGASRSGLDTMNETVPVANPNNSKSQCRRSGLSEHTQNINQVENVDRNVSIPTSKLNKKALERTSADPEGEHGSGRRASAGVTGSKIERQQAFRRQNTYPSSIPKPKIHYKQVASQVNNTISEQSKNETQNGKFHAIDESHVNESNSSMEPATSSGATAFRKAASLSEKASRTKAMNMPVIQNLSLQKMKARMGEKVEMSGGSPCSRLASTSTKKLPTSETGVKECAKNVTNGAAQRNDNSSDLRHGIPGRWSTRGTSCTRGQSPRSQPASSRSSTPGTKANLTSSKPRSVSRSSLSSSRSSLGGSKSNLGPPKGSDTKQSSTGASNCIPNRKQSGNDYCNSNIGRSQHYSKKDFTKTRVIDNASVAHQSHRNSNSRGTERSSFHDFSYKQNAKYNSNNFENGQENTELHRQRISRLPTSKSYSNLPKAKSTIADERSGNLDASGKPAKLIRQSSMYNITLNTSPTNTSASTTSSPGVNKASTNSFIPTRCFSQRSPDSAARNDFENSCQAKSPDQSDSVNNEQYIVQNVSPKLAKESDLLGGESKTKIWMRSLSSEPERSPSEIKETDLPRKFSLDDKLREWYKSISDGDTFNPHAFEQWALEHLELGHESSPKSSKVQSQGYSNSDSRHYVEKMNGESATNGAETTKEVQSNSDNHLDGLQSHDVLPNDYMENSCKSGGRTETKTIDVIERLVREQTAATAELCKSWMSDIEEKDENSSSGTSRAPSEEPPEVTNLSSPRRSFPENGNAMHSPTVKVQEEYGRSSAVRRSKKPARRSESLGLERLLPIGPPIRRSVIEDAEDVFDGDRFGGLHHANDCFAKVKNSWRRSISDGETKRMWDAPGFERTIKEHDEGKQESNEPLEEQGCLMQVNHSEQETNSIMGVDRTDTSVPQIVNTISQDASPSAKIIQPSFTSSAVPVNCETSRANHLCSSDKPSFSPSVRLIRNRPISRSERQLKATSTPEFSTVANGETRLSSRDLRRPWSHMYSEMEARKFLQRSSPSSGSLPSFNRIRSDSDGSQLFLSSGEQTPPSEVEPMTRCASLRSSSPRSSISDSMLQKFRKSFSLRFHRSSKTDHRPTAVNGSLDANGAHQNMNSTSTVQNCLKDSSSAESSSAHSDKSPPQKLQSKDNSVDGKQEESSQDSVFRLGPIILRSSKERKKMKRLKHEGGESKCNSADSGIQIEMVCPSSEAPSENNSANESPALIRRRAASASEPSTRSRQPQRPLSDLGGSHGLAEALEQTGISRERGRPEAKRTLSDTGCSELLHRLRKTPSIERQISTPPPIKLRAERARPHVRRHKGRTRLRRSISQPIDIEKLGLTHKLPDIHHGGLSDREASVDGSTASSDEEYSSDGEGYHNFCSPTRTAFAGVYEEAVTYGEALWDHVTLDPEELAFKAGEVIEVTDSSDRDWWWGSIEDRNGWFPATFVRLRVNQEDTVEDCITKMADGTIMKQMSKKISVSLLSNEQVRANVVQEIVTTERDFVQHLKDVVEGYLKQVRRRPDMFSDERISTIFGNIEHIYNFQSRFLEELESSVNRDQPHLSQIGNCFLRNEESFRIYSEYCNNHPLAVSELQELFSDPKFLHFFEACRLLQEMIDISLDGFLLTPVQKICKYPLQLAELLKYTKADHPDYEPVKNALAAMRRVAQLVNERKRRMECLEQIAEWQRTVDGWEGPDVLETSSMLIHSGDVTRVTSTWSRDLSLFLFDHLLIYCKKDLLKRTHTVYKGRIDLDSCHIYDVEDGKDLQFGVTVRNCWKVYYTKRDKWFMFYTKTAAEKERWLQAFREERQRVQDDFNQDFTVTEQAKKAAKLAVTNKLKPKRTRAKFQKGPKPHPDTAIVEILLDAPGPKSRSGSLPSNLNPRLAVAVGSRHAPVKKKGSGWFHFGSGKKPKK